MNKIKMEINIITSFFDSNMYLFLFIVPFLSQLWIPLWAMFFILFAGSITNSIEELIILFFIILIWVVIWDLLAYFLGKKIFKIKFFKYLLSKKKIKKVYDKTEKLLKKKGSVGIFISRFLITWIWPMLNYIAWIQSFNFKKFMIFMFLGEILYVSEFLILWYIFKDMIDDILWLVSDFGLALFLLFALYMIWAKLLKKKV